jgi:hypothetical protein
LNAGTTVLSLSIFGNSLNLNGNALTLTSMNFRGGSITNSGAAVNLTTTNTLVNFSGTTTIPASITVKTYNANFTNGILRVLGTFDFTTTNNGTVVGSVTNFSNASHINGTARLLGKASFIFPIGDGSFAAPMGVDNPSGSGSQVYAATYNNSAYSNLNAATGLYNVSNEEYWRLDRTGGTGGVKVRLYYDIDRSGAIYNTSDLTVAYYETSTSLWNDVGQTGKTVNTITNSTGFVVSPNFVGYSNSTTTFLFTFGSTSALNPLPIKLLNFTAVENNKSVNVKWTTINETNNDFFTIERSTDGKTWSEIGTVNAIGNSNEMIQYEMIDNTPANGVNYYRLKQTDLNGEFSHSAAVSVNFNTNASIATVYPNPASDVVNVSINTDAPATIKIVNAMGQVVMSLDNQTGIVSLNISDLSTGVYTVEVVSENQASTIKLARK